MVPSLALLSFESPVSVKESSDWQRFFTRKRLVWKSYYNKNIWIFAVKNEKHRMALQKINTSFLKIKKNNVIIKKEEDMSDEDKSDENKTIKNFDAILKDIKNIGRTTKQIKC